MLNRRLLMMPFLLSIILAGGLLPIRAATGARQAVATIRCGITISLAYNVVGIGLAMAGVLSPLVAAIMMPLSSISVVSLALHGRSFDKETA